MTFHQARGLLYLAVDITLLIFCILQIPPLLARSRAPFSAKTDPAGVAVHLIIDKDAAPALREGDLILSWNDQPVPIPPALEFLSDREAIGSRVTLRIARGGVEQSLAVTQIAYYSTAGVAVIALIGFVSWCIGVFVLFAKREDRTATVLHWSLISLAVVVTVAFEGVPPGTFLGEARSFIFFASYSGLAAGFLLFTLLFPRPRPWGGFALKTVVVSVPVALLTVAMAWTFHRALVTGSVGEFVVYRKWFDGFHVALLLYVALGIINFVTSYRSAASAEERTRIRWVLWGLCAGPAPFLLLNALPQVIGIPEPVPEVYTLIFLLLIPATFSISIVRYKLLDVEVVISRTTAYGIVVGVLLALYTALVGFAAAFIRTSATATSAITAVIVALLFEPLRRVTQSFVDRLFFRARYNYRESGRRFSERVKLAFSEAELAACLLEEAERAIPVHRIALFTLRQPGNRLSPIAHRGFDRAAHHTIRFEVERLSTSLRLPVARTSMVEPGVPFEPADDDVFARWGMALVFPLVSEAETFAGFFVLGPPRSGRRFSAEDIDLLGTMAIETGLALHRIRLQHRLVMEHAEAQRLAELNELKSDFVSYVSHELRTPLTSIKMYAELLRTRGRKLDTHGLGFLKIIEGETDRLSRMVGTILDSARIDRGEKEYRLVPADLAAIAGQVVETMAYQLTTQGFRVEFTGRTRRLPIQADADAVAEAIMNLIANSIKYSAERKYVKISLGKADGRALCSVQDRGIGIPPEAIPHLFQKFYRVANRKHRAEGIGLGLPLVKHIMDAHGGTVTVESAPGRGSTFTLAFPAMTPAAAHTENQS